MNLLTRQTALRMAVTALLTPLVILSQPANANDADYMYRYGSCPQGQKPAMLFQTEDFNATICYDSQSNFTYNGHERGTANKISLPTNTLPNEYCGGGWIAFNGNYSYTVTYDSLVVRQLIGHGINAMVMSQPVINVYDAVFGDEC